MPDKKPKITYESLTESDRVKISGFCYTMREHIPVDCAGLIKRMKRLGFDLDNKYE